jgi:Flp pilus assembly pilin Flp
VVPIARWIAARWTVDRASQAGQGLAEYALILALVAFICIAALVFLGGDIVATLNDYVAGTIAGTVH